MQPEIAKISDEGFWICVDDRELFLAFREFPWFEHEPVSKVANIQRPQPGHLYWPDLDIDLAVESIEHPERFPLVSRT